MGDKIKSFLLGVIFLAAFVGVALLITMIAMSDRSSSKETENTVEIGNSDKIISMNTEEISKAENTTTSQETVESITEQNVATDSEGETEVTDDIESETEVTEDLKADTEVGDAIEDDTTDDVIDEIEASNSSKTVSGSGDYFSDNHVDSAAPVFLIKPSKAYVTVGSTFNIDDYIGYADDVDRSVDVSVSGDINTSEVGVYSATVTLTDDAGHTSSTNISVNVVESSGSSSTSETTPPGTESFDSFASSYGGENRSLGIDVSRWQGEIDFEKVKAAGCEFVIIRLGGYDEGENYTDRYYTQNIKNAKAAGLKVGIYWHAEESNAVEVLRSSNYLLSVLGDETLDFPIAYDWEDFSNFQRYGMNLYDINDCFNMFAYEMKSAGYDTCLYSSKNFLENVWTNEKGYKVWLANYTSNTTYSGSYYMWQQSSSGIIDGIGSAVDFNIYYTDR